MLVFVVVVCVHIRLLSWLLFSPIFSRFPKWNMHIIMLFLFLKNNAGIASVAMKRTWNEREPKNKVKQIQRKRKNTFEIIRFQFHSDCNLLLYRFYWGEWTKTKSKSRIQFRMRFYCFRMRKRPNENEKYETCEKKATTINNNNNNKKYLIIYSNRSSIMLYMQRKSNLSDNCNTPNREIFFLLHIAKSILTVDFLLAKKKKCVFLKAIKNAWTD